MQLQKILTSTSANHQGMVYPNQGSDPQKEKKKKRADKIIYNIKFL